MKFYICMSILALIACATAQLELDLLKDEDFEKFMELEEASDLSLKETKGIILNSSAKRIIKNILLQMPCGWEDLGIPALAPYVNPELKIEMQQSFVNLLLNLLRFRFDGLNVLEIKRLKISYTFVRKVSFHFNFRKLSAVASEMRTQLLLDLLSQLGISVEYEGNGPLEFSLEDLSVQGSFKYKAPLIFGSLKIYNFQMSITLGGARINLGGILGNGLLNRFLNEQLEYAIPRYINANQEQISNLIEQSLVPRANAKLKGHKVWSLLGLMGRYKECIPPPAPWEGSIDES